MFRAVAADMLPAGGRLEIAFAAVMTSYVGWWAWCPAAVATCSYLLIDSDRDSDAELRTGNPVPARLTPAPVSFAAPAAALVGGNPPIPVPNKSCDASPGVDIPGAAGV